MRDLEGGESRRSNETSADRFRNFQAHEALRDGTLERPKFGTEGASGLTAIFQVKKTGNKWHDFSVRVFLFLLGKR